MDEISGKYENIEELKVKVEEYKGYAGGLIERSKTPENYTCLFNPYDHDLIPDDYELPAAEHPEPKAKANINENADEQTNFPTVISPMKRPQKDIEADGNHA